MMHKPLHFFARTIHQALCLSFILTACAEKESEVKETFNTNRKSQVISDTSSILIHNPKHKITFFQSNYFFKKESMFGYEIIAGKYRNSKPWSPSMEQVLNLESSLPVLISQHKDPVAPYDDETRNIILKNLDDYHRQYLSGITSDGDSIIDILFYKKNSFWDKDHNLSPGLPDKELVEVLGGGANYFDITYNFGLKKIVRLSINSPM